MQIVMCLAECGVHMMVSCCTALAIVASKRKAQCQLLFVTLLFKHRLRSRLSHCATSYCSQEPKC